eukprot:CAMPEP_0183814032 /NCGR_PEP_ID=MMETSP0803_2-20130417/54161_1 /TAXON_ID=195967 /ORGANISM="Crustomastix stigmata, Strain CCMP3273" /LENGTH=133 /DNA_ID=CAMNT_0026058889 /DNA_START=128 /DNA_END=526 /DNA_ORIENTATION=-
MTYVFSASHERFDLAAGCGWRCLCHSGGLFGLSIWRHMPSPPGGDLKLAASATNRSLRSALSRAAASSSPAPPLLAGLAVAAASRSSTFALCALNSSASSTPASCRDLSCFSSSTAALLMAPADTAASASARP